MEVIYEQCTRYFYSSKDYVFRPVGWSQSSFEVDGKTFYLSFNTVRVGKDGANTNSTKVKVVE